MHQLHAGEIEKWLHTYSKAWTRRSYWKRISPLFGYAVRNRMIAENPLDLLEAPKTKRQASKVYAPDQFVSMLEWAQTNSYGVMLPFLALSGLCFVRTSELVRLYKGERVMEWADILWDRRLVHVRAEVAKETRRENDERFPPFGESFERILTSHRGRQGREMIVPLLHGEFSKLWRRMHADLGFRPLPNGMRKSCISYTLAAQPELGIVRAAKYAGSSETTVKKFYLERLTQEDGESWFKLPMLF
jgi:integrase